MIVGWQVAMRVSAELTLDALQQALWARQIEGDLIHHSGSGLQYVAIRYIERLIMAGVEASIRSVGHAYDNVLAETANHPFKAELIYRSSLWKGIDHVEYTTLEWVHWSNTKRLLEPIGCISPSESEIGYHRIQQSLAAGAGLNLETIQRTRDGSIIG